MCCTQVQKAQAEGKFIVHPDWISACKFNWDKVPEKDYSLPEYTRSHRAVAARWRGFGKWAKMNTVVAAAARSMAVGAGRAPRGMTAAEDAAAALGAAGRAGR